MTGLASGVEGCGIADARSVGRGKSGLAGCIGFEMIGYAARMVELRSY